MYCSGYRLSDTVTAIVIIAVEITGKPEKKRPKSKQDPVNRVTVSNKLSFGSAGRENLTFDGGWPMEWICVRKT